MYMYIYIDRSIRRDHDRGAPVRTREAGTPDPWPLTPDPW